MFLCIENNDDNNNKKKNVRMKIMHFVFIPEIDFSRTSLLVLFFLRSYSLFQVVALITNKTALYLFQTHYHSHKNLRHYIRKGHSREILIQKSRQPLSCFQTFFYGGKVSLTYNTQQ